MRPLPVTSVGRMDSRPPKSVVLASRREPRRRVRLGRAKGLQEGAQSYVRSPHDPQPDLESPFQHRQQGSAGAAAGAVVGRARGRLNTAGQVIQLSPRHKSSSSAGPGPGWARRTRPGTPEPQPSAASQTAPVHASTARWPEREALVQDQHWTREHWRTYCTGAGSRSTRLCSWCM